MRHSLSLSNGEIPLLIDEEPRSTVVILAHGAGSHMEHRTLEWLSSLVRQAGASVVRFNFLYRALGKSMPDRMPTLIQTYRAVVDTVRRQVGPERLIVGGHSMGGRTASMMEAEGQTADGLLLFGYPLHPPGHLDKLRDAHLPQIQTPTLQLNGTEDEFCTSAIMDAIADCLDPAIWKLHWVKGADHSYSVRKSSGRSKKDAEQEILENLAPWLRAIEARQAVENRDAAAR